MSKWKAAAIYIVIWSLAALIMFGLLVAEVMPAGLGFWLILLVWLWTVINLIQVVRGKRRRLWS